MIISVSDNGPGMTEAEIRLDRQVRPRQGLVWFWSGLAIVDAVAKRSGEMLHISTDRKVA